jgi:hypothetical protein
LHQLFNHKELEMKKSLIVKMLAVPAMSLSSFAFAAEPASSAVTLTASQMDGITAGTWSSYSNQEQYNSTKQNQFLNLNVAPAVGIQALTFESINKTTSGGFSQSNGTVQVQK